MKHSGLPGDAEPKPASIIVREEGQGFGLYSTSLPRPGVAVFPGNYSPGWRTRIDGRRTEVFEANLLARGVLVPAGDHEIVLRYLPASFLWGVVISLASIGLIPTGACILCRRAKRRARRASL